MPGLSLSKKVAIIRRYDFDLIRRWKETNSSRHAATELAKKYGLSPQVVANELGGGGNLYRHHTMLESVRAALLAEMGGTDAV